MLLRLLRTHLAPYKPWLAAIVVLQFTATVAMLYLPSLNADIIDQGVAVGDTDYILPRRHDHARRLAAADPLLGRRGRLRVAHRHVVRPRRARRGLPPGRRVLRPRGRAVRRAVADHPQHQRRPAGADARAADLLAGRAGADHDGRRDRDGDARGPRPVVAAGGRGARAVPLRRPRGLADGAELPRRCSRASTTSTGSCASRSAASAWSARSCASRASGSGSPRPTTGSPRSRSAPAAGWRRCSRW